MDLNLVMLKNNMTKKLVFLGDSMLGRIDQEQIDYIRSKIPDLTIYNKAEGGISTKQGIEKINEVLELRPDYILLSFGINDLWNEKMPKDEFITNLKSIINSSDGTKVIFWCVPPVNDLKDLDGTKQFNEQLGILFDEVKKLSANDGIEIIDSFSEYKDIQDGDDTIHQEDGVHLTKEGYQPFFEALIKKISLI